jgi:hypothetical protein
MVTVQPVSSRRMVIVRPLPSLDEEVALARDRPPPLLCDDTLTDEPELLELLDALAAPDPFLPVSARSDLRATCMVSRPSLPIRTISQSSG